MSEVHDKDKQLYTLADLIDWQPPKNYRIISDGILNTKNRMIIFGDEGCWKSILALHTSNCIARGSRWLGFYTFPANVIRLQVELPMYMDRDRIQKYCLSSKQIYLSKDGHKEAVAEQLVQLDNLSNIYAYPENIVNRTEQFIHIDESSGWESLRRNILTCITELPNLPLVVILDPLYKMFNRNISDETDVKPLLDKIDLIMEDTKSIPGLSFIIIHHTRKSKTDETGRPISMGSQDATGSRALLRWADTILRIDPDPSDQTHTRVRATFTKHRNAEGILPTIILKWDKNTLHPQILGRITPNYEDSEEMELRGGYGLESLE